MIANSVVGNLYCLDGDDEPGRWPLPGPVIRPDLGRRVPWTPEVVTASPRYDRYDRPQRIPRKSREPSSLGWANSRVETWDEKVRV